VKHVLVLGAQVPFARGGAEYLNQGLLREINRKDGLQAELVQLPFKWYPEERLLDNILSWRMLDLSEANGIPIDLVIGTKFPSYAAHHPNKVLWLVHQHRVLYDLEQTRWDLEGRRVEASVRRQKLRQLDAKFIKECRTIRTISFRVSERLQQYNSIPSQPLWPPPFLKERIHPGPYGDRVIYIGRVEPLKRPELLVKALQFDKKAKVTFIGHVLEETGELIGQLIRQHGLAERCELLGFVSEEELIARLAACRAVFYAPYDEDYGYATIEAFLAEKPVITCTDSGEVRHIVAETQAGFISPPDPGAIANNLQAVYGMTDRELADMGQNGLIFAKRISWRRIIDELVLQNL